MAAPNGGGVLARGASTGLERDWQVRGEGRAGNGIGGGRDGSKASSRRMPRPNAAREAAGDGGSSGKGACGGADAEKPGDTGTKSSSLSLDRRRSSLGVMLAEGDGMTSVSGDDCGGEGVRGTASVGEGSA